MLQKLFEWLGCCNECVHGSVNTAIIQAKDKQIAELIESLKAVRQELKKERGQRKPTHGKESMV